MKVKNVLALAAANLGREELVAEIDNCVVNPAGELLSLLRCYNLVENEIALDYFPLKHEEVINVQDGKLPFEDLSYAPVEILSVRVGGKPLDFEIRPAYLQLERSMTGNVTVGYTYSPAEKGWNGECELGGKISARLLSLGVCNEFCLSNGQFGEAATWEKKYREALRAASGNRRRLSVRSRRWV